MEFKRDDVRPEQLAKEVVALANFQGGRILLGVEDDGAISGIRRDHLERWVMDAVFGQAVHPMMLPFYEEVPIDDTRRVAVITVTQGATKPYVVRYRGREDIYVRVGSTSRLASREQQARLFAVGGLIHTELLPVSGSGLRDLSRDRLADYLTAIVGDRDAPATDDAWHARLCALGFMVEREDGPPACTIAGLVLFGYRPRRLKKMVAGQRVPRNLLISETLRDYNYSDARGMGVRNKIIPSMRVHNGVDPEFEATEDYLRLTLRRRRTE